MKTFSMEKLHGHVLSAAAIMALGLSLAACSSDDAIDSTPANGKAISFTAQVTGMQSRMTNSAWDENDQVNIKIGDVVKTYTVSNKATGELTPTTDGFQWEDGKTYDVTAWYPINDVHLDLTQQATEGQTVSADAEKLLAATAHVTTQEAALSFKHQMAKVRYNLQGGIGYTDEELQNAKVTFLGYAQADFQQGELKPVGEMTAEIPFSHPDLIIWKYNEDGSHVVDETGNWVADQTIKGGDNRNGNALYVVPAEYWDKPMIKIEVAGDTFYYTPRHSNATDEEKQRGSIKPGSQIMLYFWVDKSKQTLSIKFSSSNIENWGTETDGGRVDFDGAGN